MKNLFLAAAMLVLGAGYASAAMSSDRQAPTREAGAIPRIASSLGTIRLLEPDSVRTFVEEPRSASAIPSSADQLRRMEEYSRSIPLMGGGG
jgi:hypothetical protein